MNYAKSCQIFVKIQDTALDYRNIVSFNLRTSINSVCPVGTLVFKDPDSRYISTLQNIGVGGTVNVKLLPTADDSGDNTSSGELFKAFEIKNLYIVSLSIQITDVTTQAGLVQLLLGPKWLLMRNNEITAYKDKVCTDIIKEIVEDEDFEIADNWESSTEEARPRYKMTDDYTFAQYLAARSLANNKPLFFWIDLKNKAHMTTYDTLYKADTNIASIDSTAKIASYEAANVQINGKSITSFSTIWPSTLTNVTVLSDDVAKSMETFKTFSVRSFFELMTLHGDVMSGIVDATSDITVPSGCYMPIENSLMASVEDTDIAFYANADAADMKAIAANKSKAFLGLTKLQLTGPFVQILPGDTLTVCQLIGIHEAKNVYSSWINCKWLVSDVLITYQNAEVYESVTLSSPFVTVAKNESDVANEFGIASSLKQEFYEPKS